MATELRRALRQLGEMQLSNGMWPWFPGGGENEYLTLYIVAGFGRLRHVGVELPTEGSSGVSGLVIRDFMQRLRSSNRQAEAENLLRRPDLPAIVALDALDRWIRRWYDKRTNSQISLDSSVALYLYARSFFIKDLPVAESVKPAFDFFQEEARQDWQKLGSRQSQGHLALAFHRLGDAQTARAIMKSLREHAVHDNELGMFWRDTEASWWWHRAPIETQALMIEAFDEVLQDAQAVEDCNVWLLKQRQTQGWRTTKATADAVYALLQRGANWLASNVLVDVSLGGIDVLKRQATFQSTQGKVGSRPAIEPGMGFYEDYFAPAAINPNLSEIIVTKSDPGLAWGSVHWQYFEDVDKVTPHPATPLKLRKALFMKKTTSSGPVLEAVNNPVRVGDELVVRIELRVDRDMEFVHLRDQRGSGLEPLNVISGSRWQDGLGYYESTRDTASLFFIDYLRKGTYVFEYSNRVFHRGEYQSGIADIQCMYAPEFNSHSESILIRVE